MTGSRSQDVGYAVGATEPRRLGYSLNEAVSYAVPTSDLRRRILDGEKIAFRVGPWERRLKEKELQKLRAFAMNPRESK